MRVLLTLAVCGALAGLAVSTPVHERNADKMKAKHGAGAPHRLNPAFLDRSDRSITGVEAEVNSQRLDAEADMRTKELLSQIGKMEGELEEAQGSNAHLNGRIAKEEVSFAQKEEKFQGQIVEFQRDKKIADDWAWRLEMGFIAQFLVALTLSLSCFLCHCQTCSTPCNALVKKPDMQAKRNWAATHRPMDPDLKEKLRIRRMNLDAPVSPAKDGNLQNGVNTEQPKACAYFSLAEEDADHAEESTPTPRSSAFPAVFSEPRSPTSKPKPPVPQLAMPASAPDQVDSSWWGTPR